MKNLEQLDLVALGAAELQEVQGGVTEVGKWSPGINPAADFNNNGPVFQGPVYGPIIINCPPPTPPPTPTPIS